MSTRKFIEQVHDAFDELGYRVSGAVNFEEFHRTAMRALAHCYELQDARNAILKYRFCLKEWHKIERMFKQNSAVFNEYEYEENSVISLLSDEEAVGNYYITNGITGNSDDIYVASCSLDEETVKFGCRLGKIGLLDDEQRNLDCNYYLKYSKRLSKKMKLFDSGDKCLCNIVLSDKYGIFLESNLTPYFLLANEDGATVFARNRIVTQDDDEQAVAYIDDTEDIKEQSNIYTEGMEAMSEQPVAYIAWDLLEKDGKAGVAKLEVYAPDQDLEMLLLFAASMFLVFQKYMDAQRATGLV